MPAAIDYSSDGLFFGKGHIVLNKVCLINTEAYIPYRTRGDDQDIRDYQSYYSLCGSGQISNCFIIDQTSMEFSALYSEVVNSYYVGPATTDMGVYGIDEDGDYSIRPIPPGQWSPFGTNSVSNCYMYLTEGTITGNGTQVTQAQMRDINTFLPEWDIAPGMIRRNEIWAIGDGPSALTITVEYQPEFDHLQSATAECHLSDADGTEVNSDGMVVNNNGDRVFYFSQQSIEKMSWGIRASASISVGEFQGSPEEKQYWADWCYASDQYDHTGNWTGTILINSTGDIDLSGDIIPINVNLRISAPMCNFWY